MSKVLYGKNAGASLALLGARPRRSRRSLTKIRIPLSKLSWAFIFHKTWRNKWSAASDCSIIPLRLIAICRSVLSSVSWARLIRSWALMPAKTNIYHTRILSVMNNHGEFAFTSPLAQRYHAQWLFPGRSPHTEQHKSLLDLVKKATWCPPLLSVAQLHLHDFRKRPIFSTC